MICCLHSEGEVLAGMRWRRRSGVDRIAQFRLGRQSLTHVAEWGANKLRKQRELRLRDSRSAFRVPGNGQPHG